MKKFTATILVFALLLSLSACGGKSDSIENSIAFHTDSNAFYYQGQHGFLDEEDKFVTPVIRDDIVFVPVDSLATAFGAAADTSDSSSATITATEKRSKFNTITLNVDSVYMTIDDGEEALETAPITVDEKLYVPLISFAEALGKKHFNHQGLILLTNKEHKYSAEVLNTFVEENFDCYKITELPVNQSLSQIYYQQTKQRIPEDFEAIVSAYSSSLTTVGQIKYTLADLTEDGQDELVATAGAVVAVYTYTGSEVKQIFTGVSGISASTTLLVLKDGEHYLYLGSSSSSTGFANSLSKLTSDGDIIDKFSSRTIFSADYTTEEYVVNEAIVSQDTYNEFNDELGELRTVAFYPASMLKGSSDTEPQLYRNVDYEAVYRNYLQDIVSSIGRKSGSISELDMHSFSFDGYAPEKGLVCALVEDMSEDGIPDLITVEEIESSDGFFDDSTDSSLLVSAYTVSDKMIVPIDSWEVSNLLPLFSFVDVTKKGNNIIISGIGAWAGDPGFNDHYILSLSNNGFNETLLSSNDIYTCGEYDTMSSEEKKQIDDALKRLRSYGFDYTEPDNITGGCDLSATRLAFYSLFGPEGRYSEYFKNSMELKKGFTNFTNLHMDPDVQ